LQNFVLHRSREGEQSSREGEQKGTADSDLLAIRFPHVYEEIGGKEQDWDRGRFSSWGMEIDKDNLAFIIEVKSGSNVSKNDMKDAFSRERLRKAIYRFGIFPKSRVPSITAKLQNEKQIKVDSWLVAKLAVTEEGVAGPWLNLLLYEADQFIQNRISLSSKYRDRVYFPNALIQYLAWKQFRLC
jgi:hypothetical protein